MIRIGVIGKNGKMGQTLIKIIENMQLFELGAVIGKEDDTSTIMQNSDVDIWIDFSLGKHALYHTQLASKHGKPILICTTGPDIDLPSIKNIKNIPTMYAPNISINWLKTRRAIIGMEEIEDALIEDVHHHTKLDKPSGASMDIKTEFEKANIKVTCWSARTDIQGAKLKLELSNKNELMTFSYTTFNRTPYATGALLAAQWLYAQEPGFYNTDDFLKTL